MLTEAEKKWLKARRGTRCSSGYFAFTSDSIMDYVRYNRALTPDWKDAAEFEARVAAKLAEGPEDCAECFWGTSGWSADNAEGRLKHARLAVEEEMDTK